MGGSQDSPQETGNAAKRTPLKLLVVVVVVAVLGFAAFEFLPVGDFVSGIISGQQSAVAGEKEKNNELALQNIYAALSGELTDEQIKGMPLSAFRLDDPMIEQCDDDDEFKPTDENKAKFMDKYGFRYEERINNPERAVVRNDNVYNLLKSDGELGGWKIVNSRYEIGAPYAIVIYKPDGGWVAFVDHDNDGRIDNLEV